MYLTRSSMFQFFMKLRKILSLVHILKVRENILNLKYRIFKENGKSISISRIFNKKLFQSVDLKVFVLKVSFHFCFVLVDVKRGLPNLNKLQALIVLIPKIKYFNCHKSIDEDFCLALSGSSYRDKCKHILVEQLLILIHNEKLMMI